MLIEIRRLIKYTVNPLESVEDLWGCLPFTPEQVRIAYLEKLFWENPTSREDKKFAQVNIQRIAYFMKRMPSDPISIDVGIPSLGYHMDDIILDGWHRIYATIMRRDKFIKADLSGDIAEIQRTICPDYTGVTMRRSWR